jgi:hypothetical protein
MNNSSQSPQSNAQGGEQDTNRQQSQGSYQQGQNTAQQDQQGYAPPPTHRRESAQKGQSPQSNAQGGEQDTNRQQPQGSYQQGSS